MSNGARHAIGVVIGLIAIPVIIYGLALSGRWVILSFQQVVPELRPQVLLGIAAVLAIGAVLGVLAASRVSPLAALLAGLGVGVYGILTSFPTPARSFLMIPIGEIRPLDAGTVHLLLLGGLLTVSALFPSRWRAAQPRETWHRPPWQEGPGMGPGHMQASRSPSEEAERPPFTPGAPMPQQGPGGPPPQQDSGPQHPPPSIDPRGRPPGTH